MPYSKEACRTHWKKMTDMDPRDTYIKNPFRRQKQREQLERAFERYLQHQSQSTSVAPVISQVVGPRSPSMLVAILDASFDSSSLPATNIITTASSDQRAEPPDILSPPLLTSEGTTPTNSIHSIPTPPSQDVIHIGVMPGEVKELNASMVRRPEGEGASHSSHRTQITSIKRSAPLEFNESLNASSGRVLNGPPIPSTQEELAWTQKNPHSAPVHECENRSPSMPTTSLSAVQEEAEPVRKKPPKHPSTMSEVEDEMKAPRGFIKFIKYGLTKSRLSVQSMISASGTIRSRFSSRRSSRQSIMASQLQEETNSFHYASYMSERDQLLSAIQPPQPVNYEGGRQATSLFLELRLAGASDDHVTARLKELLQGMGSTRARSVANTRNTSRETPLEVALALGNVPACRILLEAGADVHARTWNGKSLSEFGREAQSEANNNAQYIAIGACKNVILSHSRLQKNINSRRAENVKSGITPHANRRMAVESGRAQRAQPPSHEMTGGSALYAHRPEADMIQDETCLAAFDDTTHQPRRTGAFGGIDSLKSNPASMPMATSALHSPAPGSISSHQTLPPDVPDLIPFWNSAGPTDSASWQNQTLQSLSTNPSQRLRPDSMLWNSYFQPSTDITSSTPLDGGLATRDMSSVAGNVFLSAEIGSEVMPGTHSGRYEPLPDGHVFGHSSVSRAPRPLGQHFCHRDARVFDMGNSVQLQVPMITETNSSPPSLHTLVGRDPKFGQNINPYGHMGKDAVYSNTSLQQQQQCPHNTNFAESNYLPNPPTTSGTYDFSVSNLVRQLAVPFNDTLQSNNLISSPPSQQTCLSAMELEARSLQLPLSNVDNHVLYWDSWPSGP
jgi:hypothetical protein